MQLLDVTRLRASGLSKLLIVLCAALLTLGCGADEQEGSPQEEPANDTPNASESASEPTGEPRAEEDAAPGEPRAEEDAASEEAQIEEPSAAESSPEETLELQYQYINTGAYEEAYELFTEESRQRVSLEQYLAYFEETAPYRVTDYTFPSVEVQGETAIVEISVTVTTGTTGAQQLQRTQELELADEGWLVVMRDEQVESFTNTMPEPEEPEADTDPEPPTELQSIELSGVGQQASDLFELETGLAVVTMTHQGQSNFIVDLLDDQGQPVGFMGLANVIGPFEGSTAVQTEAGQHVLDVQADGPWSITIEQPKPEQAPPTRVFSGTSKAATEFFELEAGLHRVNLTHQGDSNFIVDLLDEDGASVEVMGLVNEIGSFDGSTTITVPEDGIYLFNVEGNGPWTIQIED